MGFILNILKSVLYGIVQGITEWLPISSTAHLILMKSFLPLSVFEDPAANLAFWDMYKVVIQLGSILAVCLLYWNRLNPFNKRLKKEKKQNIIRLWILIVIGCIPAGILGLLLDDWIDNVMSSTFVIAATLIIYGALLIWMESRPKKYAIQNLNDITPKSALGVGLFQALALIPGTSRSGATILGGTLLGFDRPTIVEFTFYLAIPTMLGASIVKIIKFIVKGAVMNVTGFFTLIVGMAISFLVSVVAIRYVMAYIRKHDFRIFGIYRILLGIIVLIFTLFKVIA